ncbi:hypothetical protein C7436_3461 [Marinobacter nauticus]|nr:hypothetical protein C7436_3461 [Marinobacter nauticus]
MNSPCSHLTSKEQLVKLHYAVTEENWTVPTY